MKKFAALAVLVLFALVLSVSCASQSAAANEYPPVDESAERQGMVELYTPFNEYDCAIDKKNYPNGCE